MKQFYFVIRDNKIDYIDFSAKAPIIEYIRFYGAPVREKIDYTITNGEVSDIICETDSITTAIAAVEKFLRFQCVIK